MADKIKFTLEVDAQKGLVTLRDFDKAFNKLGDDVDDAGKKGGRAASGFTSLETALKGAIAYFSVRAVVDFTGKLVDAEQRARALGRAFTAITGDSAAAGAEMDYLRATSDELGLKFYDVADAYKGITAAAKGTNLEGQVTKDIFRAVTEASTVLGLSTEQTNGALVALNQIISKNTVSSEELRQQLSERIPGSMQMAAQAMGVTTKQLNKMLESGQILAEDLLPKLAEVMHNRFGQAALTAANDSDKAFNRLDTSITDLYATIGGKLTPALQSAAEEATGLIQTLNESIKTGSYGAFFERLFTGYSDATGLRDVNMQLAKAKRELDDLYSDPMTTSNPQREAFLENRIQQLEAEKRIIEAYDQEKKALADLAKRQQQGAATQKALDEKVLEARNKLWLETQKLTEEGYDKELLLIEEKYAKFLGETKDEVAAREWRDAAIAALDQKIEDENDARTAKFLEQLDKKTREDVEKTTKSLKEQRDARQEYEIEVARLSGDTRKVQELELNKYIDSLSAAALSAQEIERLKNLKIQEMNKSTLDKWIDAWSDTGARMQDIMKTTFENLTNAAGNFFGDLLFDIRSLDDGLRSLEKTGKDIIKNIFGSASTAYLQGGIAGLFKGQGFSGFSLDSIVKAFSSSQGGGSGAGGFAAIPAAGGTGAGIWSAATGGGAAYGTAYAGAQQAALGFSAKGAAGSTAAAAGLLGPAGLMGAAAAPVIIGNVLGPYINELFGMTGTYSPEDAQARIAQDLEGLTTGIAALTDAAQKMGDMFGGYLTPEIMRASSEIEALADVSGYGQAGVDAMTDALGGQAAAVVEAGSVAQQLNYQLADLVWNFKLADEQGSALGGGVNELTTLMDDLIYSLDLGADRTEALKDISHDLAEELYLGNMTVEQITGSLQDEFNAALERAISSGEVTAETMRGVAEAIKSIPTSWSTTYSVRGPGTSTYTDALPTYDQGHIPVLDTGSMPGHYLAWLQPGEPVIRESSVNRQTLPVIDHINRTGQVPATGGGDITVNLTINADMLDSPTGAMNIARKVVDAIDRYKTLLPGRA